MVWFWKKFTDQRKWRRTLCRAAATLTYGRAVVPGAVIDLSRGGCLFQPSTPLLFTERVATLVVGGARMGVRLLRRGDRGQHLCFDMPLSPSQHDDILDTIDRERRGLDGDADAANWLAAKDRRRPPGRNA